MSEVNPTKEDFLQNPRAKELRQICLAIADATNQVMHEADKQSQYAILGQMQDRLIALGITTKMHVGLDQAAYQNPVTAAEYVVGQWVNQLGRTFPSEESVLPILEECSQQHVGNAYVISGENFHPEVLDLAVMRLFVDKTYRFLDAEQGATIPVKKILRSLQTICFLLWYNEAFYHLRRQWLGRRRICRDCGKRTWKWSLYDPQDGTAACEDCYPNP